VAGPSPFSSPWSQRMLLFIAAQAGFADGPNVLSNMAIDSLGTPTFSQPSQRPGADERYQVMGLAALFPSVGLTGGRAGTCWAAVGSINVLRQPPPLPAQHVRTGGRCAVSRDGGTRFLINGMG